MKWMGENKMGSYRIEDQRPGDVKVLTRNGKYDIVNANFLDHYVRIGYVVALA